MKHILTTHQLSKNYGNLKAVNQLNISVEKGSVYGLLGPNGSGKSTTLSMLLRIVKPSSGTWEWFGSTDHETSIKKIGAIIESPKFYPYLTAFQNLKIVADIKEVNYQKIDPVLQLVGLLERKNDKYQHYSLGMKQRLAIASAMINNPEVLILDEPTNGLDPEGIIQVREIIQKIATNGTTIIMASHLLDEVEKVCSHVLILNKGEAVYNGSLAEMSISNISVEIAANDMRQLIQVLNEIPWVQSFEAANQKVKVILTEEISPETINEYFFGKGIILTHLINIKPKLETLFFELLNAPQHV